jgi:hypothetical protein
MSDLPFKTNFADLQEESGLVSENYDLPSNVRNVNFVLSNGNEAMRNYAYLVSVDLYKGGERNLLEVGFTSDAILITGYKLKALSDLFMRHIPKIIVPSNSRYYSDDDPYTVINIEVGNKRAI